MDLLHDLLYNSIIETCTQKSHERVYKMYGGKNEKNDYYFFVVNNAFKRAFGLLG